VSDPAAFAARRRRPPRRSPWPRIIAAAALAALIFALGVALGMALQERPTAGGEQTIVRTLEPLPQQTTTP
jgi:hypothetical protein